MSNLNFTVFIASVLVMFKNGMTNINFAVILGIVPFLARILDSFLANMARPSLPEKRRKLPAVVQFCVQIQQWIRE